MPTTNNPLFQRITHTHNSIVIHQPADATIIEEIWYAIIDKNGADPTTYEISAYITGWWALWDDRENNTFFKRHGGAFLVEYPEPILEFQDGWLGLEHCWVKPINRRANPCYQPHMLWAVEFCFYSSHPSFQATPYYKHVVDTKSADLPAFLDDLAVRAVTPTSE